MPKLTHDDFVEKVDSKFQVHLESGKQLDVTLTQVSDEDVSSRQEQFSILFHGPLSTFLPQGIYRLRHATMGLFDLFLVPVGKSTEAYEYEAVFNRMRHTK